MRHHDPVAKRRPPGWLPPVLAAASTLLVAVLAVATNRATELLPTSWAWIDAAWLWWGLVVTLALVVAGLAAWQVRATAPPPQAGGGALGGVAGGPATGPDLQGGQPAGTTTVASAGSLPRPVANLPPRSPHFTGRTDLLADLDRHLRSGTPTAVMAVGGLGGVGKTQLALEYAYQHLHQIRLAWWIPAETALAVATALADLAPHLGLPAETELEATAASVLGWLRRHSDWLLIFDNASHPDQLRAYLPAPGHGRVVITSRNPAFAQLAPVLPVEPLSEQEAVAYLLERTGSQNLSAARELAKELGGLPLALVQAGA